MDFDDKSGEVSETYKLLAVLFMKEPDLGTVEHFQDVFQIELQESLYDITDDYVQLFQGHEGNLTPYESAYVQMADSPVMSEDVRESVYHAYLREGLVLDDINIIPDHISAELFFISYLVEAGRKDSLRDFLQRHALQWIPQFCDDLYESAGTVFYRELAAVTKDYILNEYEELSSG
jgi:anaerobic sulfite reductase subunit A